MPEDCQQEGGSHRRGQEARDGLDVDEELGVAEGADDGDPGHGEKNQRHHEAPEIREQATL